MTTRTLLNMTGLLIMLGASAATASPPAMAPIMKSVNAVLAAMNDHNPKTLAGAYANGAVIVDSQAPFQWSGSSAPSDWLSAISTWGKMRSAHFTATADPMSIQGAPGAAYVIVRGTLRGFGQRNGVRQNAALTFSLREVNGAWKITNQSWTSL